MKRLEYIDNTKGFAILGILILHIFKVNSITIWIDSFVVSLFFILTGYIYAIKNKQVGIKYIIKNRFITLMIPYYIFCCVHIIFRIINQGRIDPEVKGYILSTMNLFGVEALWYLPALYISEIIFVIINNKINKKYIKIFIIIIILLLGIFSKEIIEQNTFTYCIFRSLIGTSMIYIGFLFYKVINYKNTLLSMLILLSISIFTSQENGLIDVWSLTFNNKVLFIISALSGSFFIIRFFYKYNINMTYLGKNSLIIMATHQIFMQISEKVGINNYFIEFLFVMVCEFITIWIINNYALWILGKFK